MCFGSKKKNLYDDVDEPPRPAPGHAPQQPIYALDPKSAPPSSSHQQQQYISHGPISPQTPTYAQQPQYQYQQHQQQTSANMPAELPNTQPSHAPVELATNDYAPPPGPPPDQRPQTDNSAPPPGPPPSHSHGGNDFAPPPGPPPSHGASHNGYAPPPGPPPSHNVDYTAPPPGAPPMPSGKPKHEWETLVPDTSLFPPPPSFFSGFDRSPATNATEAEAEAGEAWCRQHPLSAPITLDPGALEALRSHNPRLMEPVGFNGTLKFKAPGVWAGQTDKKALDTCIIGYPPLYSVQAHSPLLPNNPLKTIYFEVLITSTTNREICLSLGFTALPYPSFRQPGWHRGSLAVHGDDGHKFINDRWGGKDFTAPFVKGERYGIGMTFRAVGGRIETEVFFTRNGMESGRWNLHEETDAAEDLPVTGLEGYHDLSCAVGTYGGVGFEAIFDPTKWAHVPAGYHDKPPVY